MTQEQGLGNYNTEPLPGQIRRRLCAFEASTLPQAATIF